MAVPTICGLETEYGLLVPAGAGFSQEQAALALLARCPLTPRVPWEMSGESPERDARHPSATAGARREDSGGEAGFMLGNGARLYVDHGHPEYATPECSDPLALLCADRAGELLLDRCRRRFDRFLPLDQSLQLIKNNGDHQGHSYACHENYLVSARLYRDIFSGGPSPLLTNLVPFLVSRTVVGGAGKVGSDNGRPAADFQLAQRADFFETVLGLQTMSHRPIVNTRDEPHGDPARFRRLHVITGDSNMAQVSTYLKAGTLHLVLAMLEDRVPLPDMTLAEPVSALVAISHDPGCRRRVPLADGRRLSAIEMQLAFAAAAQRYAGSPDAPGWAPRLASRWGDVLCRLEEDPRQLGATLDWAIKLALLDNWRQGKGLQWTAAELRELDIRYHDIDRESSVFYTLERAGGVDTLVTEEEIGKAIDEPPSSNRAAVRAALLRRHAGQMIAASWGALTRRDGVGGTLRLELDDPAVALAPDAQAPSWGPGAAMSSRWGEEEPGA